MRLNIKSVFFIIPKEIISGLQGKFFFYIWNEEHSEVRWMTSFDTTEKNIIKFVRKLKHVIK